jgi:hypothetical protein
LGKRPPEGSENGKCGEEARNVTRKREKRRGNGKGRMETGKCGREMGICNPEMGEGAGTRPEG